MAKVTETVAALAGPVVEKNGCTLWDVEYVKEAGVWYLRVYIDKEGGVSINDCVAIDHDMDPILEAHDPIEGSYTFEVSSAGADRVLKKPEHFAAFLGSEVEVRLYRAREGRKEWTAILTAYDPDSGNVTVSTDGGEVVFEKKDVAQVRLSVRV